MGRRLRGIRAGRILGFHRHWTNRRLFPRMVGCPWHKPRRRPRERGDPVDTKPPVHLGITKFFAPGLLGPGVRGDDSGESLLPASAGTSGNTRPFKLSSSRSRAKRLRSPPEFSRGDARAFRHGGKLRKDDVGIDRGLSDPGAVAAVGAGKYVLAADKPRIAADALRDQRR